jgi:hypothetical protein
MNTKDKYLIKLKKLLDILGPSGPKTYILTGSMVIYLYKLRLTNIINSNYRKPNDFDFCCSKSFFKTLVPKDYDKDHFSKSYPTIGKVDFYLCKKTKTMKNALKFEDICYCINLDDLIESKKQDLTNSVLDMYKIYFDINFISKLILLKISLTKKLDIDTKTHELIKQQFV